jgi:hypothetical protein
MSIMRRHTEEPLFVQPRGRSMGHAATLRAPHRKGDQRALRVRSATPSGGASKVQDLDQQTRPQSPSRYAPDRSALRERSQTQRAIGHRGERRYREQHPDYRAESRASHKRMPHARNSNATDCFIFASIACSAASTSSVLSVRVSSRYDSVTVTLFLPAAKGLPRYVVTNR